MSDYFFHCWNRSVNYCVTSEVDGDPVDGVFVTEADRPVGMAVIRGGVDTVAFGVGCAFIIIDGCTAVIVVMILIH